MTRAVVAALIALAVCLIWDMNLIHTIEVTLAGAVAGGPLGSVFAGRPRWGR